MGKSFITVALDSEKTILVEVPEDETGSVLVPISGNALTQAGESVQAAVDNVIKPTVDTILTKLRHGVHQPESVELEFGLKLAGKLGAVFASSQAEGHIKVKMAWKRPEPTPDQAPGSAPEGS